MNCINLNRPKTDLRRVMATGALIVAVGTPSDEDGSANLKHVPASPCRPQNSAKRRTSIEFAASRSESGRLDSLLESAATLERFHGTLSRLAVPKGRADPGSPLACNDCVELVCKT